jgi:DNA-binding transcriptional ArsR family regulator
MESLERNLRALANGRRLAIVRHPRNGKSASVSALADVIKLSFKSTSRHLAVLTGAGVLEKKQVGLEMMHSLKKERHGIVNDILKHL